MDTHLLQQVLDMESQEEKLASHRAVEARIKSAQYEQKQKEFEAYKKEYEAQVKQKGAAGVNSDYLAAYEHFRGALDEVVTQQRQLRGGSIRREKILRDQWQLSQQRKKALQQLIDNRERDVRRAENRREQAHQEESFYGHSRLGH